MVTQTSSINAMTPRSRNVRLYVLVGGGGARLRMGTTRLTRAASSAPIFPVRDLRWAFICSARVVMSCDMRITSSVLLRLEVPRAGLWLAKLAISRVFACKSTTGDPSAGRVGNDEREGSLLSSKPHGSATCQRTHRPPAGAAGTQPGHSEWKALPP
jgi:hypothetical protein